MIARASKKKEDSRKGQPDQNILNDSARIEQPGQGCKHSTVTAMTEHLEQDRIAVTGQRELESLNRTIRLGQDRRVRKGLPGRI
jgi:hypothetical protein